MSSPKPLDSTGPVTKGGRAYHHGDLRAALISAAREALETVAPEAISLKSLAAGLGVSQPAPYRHFPSRDALLAAVATQGFEQFRAELAAAAAVPDPEGFERSCLAYLAFGRDNPGLYRLMFASQLLCTARDEALEDAARGAFDLVLQQMAGRVPEADLQASAVWVWSTLHGLVMLEAEGLTGGASRNQVPSTQVVRRMVRSFGAK